MTIYIDVILIENLIMNFIILYATGLVLKRKIKKVRLILASLLGAIYSLLTYISSFEIYTNIILKLILSILMVYIAFNAPNVKQIGKDLLLFYLVSFVFGVAAFAFIYIIKPQDILMINGLFLVTYPLKTVVLGAIIAFIIVIAAFKIVKSRFSTKDMYCKIKIRLNEKEIETNAMIDSGNLLKEPISNTPVIIVEHTLLYDCMPKEILNNLENMIRR